jgi:divalent metal cation (Fe/Co/Zn/Cd) transporter
VHILVPGSWTIQQGHDLVEQLEAEIRSQINYCSVFTHIEPVEDPRALSDLGLDRETPG